MDGRTIIGIIVTEISMSSSRSFLFPTSWLSHFLSIHLSVRREGQNEKPERARVQANHAIFSRCYWDKCFSYESRSECINLAYK